MKRVWRRNIFERRRLIYLVLAMILVAGATCGIALFMVYRVALGLQKQSLSGIAISEAEYIETLHDLTHVATIGATTEGSQQVSQEVLSHVIESAERHPDLGQTGELVIGEMQDGQICIVASSRWQEGQTAPLAPVAQQAATPMHLALQGMTGSVEGRDYRGVPVYAAYAPVAGINWGVVAKIDLAEIRRPFIFAAAYTLLIMMLMIALAAAWFTRVTNPLLRKVAESEQQLRLLLDSTAEAIYGIDLHGNCTFCNPACLHLLGYNQPEELLGKNMHELIHHSHADKTPYPMAECLIFKAFLKGEGVHVADEVLWRADGTSFDAEYWSYPQRKGAAVVGAVVAFLDITERKVIEQTLMFLLECGNAESGEDFFASLARYLAVSLGMDYVCIDRLLEGNLAAQTVAVYFDGAFEDNVAYTLQDTPCGDAVGKNTCTFTSEIRQLFPRDEVLQQMQAESYAGVTLWSSTGQPIGLIALISRRPLEHTQLVESVLKVVAVRAAGELERRQAEDALREQSRLSQILLDHIPCIAILVKYGDYEIAALNEPACKGGAATAACCYRSLWNRTAPCPWCMAQTMRETGQPQHVEFEEDGAVLDGYWVPVSDELYLHYVFDVTERKQIEARLRDLNYQLHESNEELTAVNEELVAANDELYASNDELVHAQRMLEEAKIYAETLIETANVLVVGLNREGRVELLNQAAVQALGYAREELLGGDWFEIAIPPRHRAEALQAFSEWQRGETELARQTTYTIATKTGQQLAIEWRNSALWQDGLVVGTISFGMDVTERKQLQFALAESERRFRSLVETDRDLILRVNGDLTVDYSNPALLGLLGTSMADIAGCPLSAMNISAELQQALLSVLHAVLTGRDVVRRQLDGAVGQVQGTWDWYAVPEFDKGGQVVAAVAVARNISEIAEAQRMAEAANVAKTKFLASMSHELRSPLTAINGFSELFLEQTFGPLNDQQRKHAQIIHNSGEHLLVLIDGLLDIAKIESGHLQLAQTQVDLSLVCQEASDILRGRITGKGLALLLDLPQQPVFVRGDQIRLRQVLLNLLVNASKFTQSGAVTLWLRDYADRAELGVRDTGIGIAEDDLQRIFLPFVQVHDNLNGSEAGTGLGLALCREITEAHGGKISVQSQVGQGSEFTVYLPKRGNEQDG